MEKYEESRQAELKLFVIEFSRASQIDRSFSGSKVPAQAKRSFREQLLAECMNLFAKVDNGTLKNVDIRTAISRLAEKPISYGQAQKVVNVVLKQYCFLCNQSALIRELDCPLDSIVMAKHAGTNRRLKTINEDDYLEYQRQVETEHPTRVFADMEYAQQRVDNFLMPDSA